MRRPSGVVPFETPRQERKRKHAAVLGQLRLLAGARVPGTRIRRVPKYDGPDELQLRANEHLRLVRQDAYTVTLRFVEERHLIPGAARTSRIAGGGEVVRREYALETVVMVTKAVPLPRETGVGGRRTVRILTFDWQAPGRGMHLLTR